MLKVENLTTSYKTINGDIKVCNDISFEIRENEIFGIAGESGCGKTTLLRALYDLIEPPLQVENGRVVLCGTKNGEPYSFETGFIKNSWWKNISYVPQAAQSVLNPIARLKQHFLDSIPKDQRSLETPKETLARVQKYLEDLELPSDILEAYPFQLSGGMRQRAIIALATYMAPDVILADEPTTALDVVVQRGILMLLMRLQKQYKNSLVIVSHDMGVHYQITNRIGIMYSGSFAEMGDTDDIFNDPIHPYTQLLVAALPKVGDKSSRAGIPGRPPALADPPPGCRFAPRCPLAKDVCRVSVPVFKEAKPGRYAACHFIGENAVEVRAR